MLSGSSDPAGAAAFFRERGVDNIVVKLGAKGCDAFLAGEYFHAPAFSVDVVDTTGAGDCFAGGFLAGLHAGVEFREAMRWANAAGALCAANLGGTAGIPSKADFLKFLDGCEVGQAVELK